MSLKVPSLDRLSQELAKLPGIGQKTAQRLAMSIIKKEGVEIENLRESLLAVKEKIKVCSSCFCYTENLEECDFCTDTRRQDTGLFCVVKSPTDIAKIEESGVFRGLYHVLHGCIAPLDGVGPDDIKINELIERLQKIKNKEIEVIIALDADIEGDTTSLYLKEVLSQENVKVTRLAHGVPIGSFIDFIDQRTLSRALENRIKL